jgi:hypothetical protein
MATNPVPAATLTVPVPAQYQQLVISAATQYGVPVNILAAQIQQESGFDPNATSSAGAEGIAQFEPATAASNGVNPWDPNSAIPGMARLDASYAKTFGSWELALAAYNAGPGAVESAGNAIPNITQTQDYVSSIMSAAGGSGSDPVPSGTVEPTSATSTAASAIGGFSGIFHVFSTIGSGSFWTRIGKGLLGAVIIVFGLVYLRGPKNVLDDGAKAATIMAA